MAKSTSSASTFSRRIRRITNVSAESQRFVDANQHGSRKRSRRTSMTFLPFAWAAFGSRFQVNWRSAGPVQSCMLALAGDSRSAEVDRISRAAPANSRDKKTRRGKTRVSRRRLHCCPNRIYRFSIGFAMTGQRALLTSLLARR